MYLPAFIAPVSTIGGCNMAVRGIFTSVLQWLAACALILAAPALVRADIYEWEYVDPGNPALGKQQSTTLVPDGAGVTPAPDEILVNRDFTKAYLFAANLSGARLRVSNLSEAYLAGATLSYVPFNNATLTNADLSGANLSGAVLTEAWLTGADLTGADISHADFSSTTAYGFTASQLYSTSSYQNHALSGIDFSDAGNDLSGWDFSAQDLTDAQFSFTTLAGANFQDAIVRGASLYNTTAAGFTAAALYATKSYQDHDLGAIDLSRNDLTGWDLAGQDLEHVAFIGAELADVDFSHANLTNAEFRDAQFSNTNFAQATLVNVDFYQRNLTGSNFRSANLTGAQFTGATLTTADFQGATVRGARLSGAPANGFTMAQLYSTMSYQTGDLRGIELQSDVFPGIDLAGRDLSGADLGLADLSSGDFRGASLGNSYLGGANLMGADFRGADLTDAYAEADWRNARLDSALLTGTNFYRASLQGAVFDDAVVRGAVFDADDAGTCLTAAQLYSTASYKQHDLTGVLIKGDLTGWDFSQQDLTDAVLDRSTLVNVDWTAAKLNRTSFYVAHLGGADLSGAELTGTDFTAAYLTGANFSNCSLPAVSFHQAKLGSADFSGANLAGNDLALADLTGTNLSGADLRDASFHFATLTGANLMGALISGARFSESDGFTLAQLYQTGSYVQRDLHGVDFEDLDLSGADFQNQDLSDAGFLSADLTGANLSGANLTGAAFRAATLDGVDVSGADVRGADFNIAMTNGFTLTQLYSTASYQQQDLSGITLSSNDLAGADFSGQDLSRAVLHHANLAGVDFSGATIRNADLRATVGTLTPAQLYATRSYQFLDLRGVNLLENALAGLDFHDQNLTNSSFDQANGADFRRADLRGMGGDARLGVNWGTAVLENTIRQDGTIQGLSLAAGERLLVRDYDGNPNAYPDPLPPIAIEVQDGFAMDGASALQFVLEADEWDSLISFDEGIDVALDGRLILGFAADVDVSTQLGRTFQLFDWTGVAPTGSFAIESVYGWNVARLYTTGEVILTSVAVLTGDYNGDGVVDAADYSVWRDTLGSTTDLRANGDNSGASMGVIDEADYAVWQAHFGQAAATGLAASGAVPEPATWGMLLAGLLGVVGRGRKRGG